MSQYKMEGGERKGTCSTFIADFNTVGYKPKKQLRENREGNLSPVPSLHPKWSLRKPALTLPLLHIHLEQADTFLTAAQQTTPSFRPAKNNDPSSES